MVLETSTLDNVYVVVPTIGTKHIKTNKSLLSCLLCKASALRQRQGEEYRGPWRPEFYCLFVSYPQKKCTEIWENTGKNMGIYQILPRFFSFLFLIDTFSQGIPRRMGISPGWRSSGSSHWNQPLMGRNRYNNICLFRIYTWYIPSRIMRICEFHWRNLGPQPSRSLSLHQDSCWQHIVFQQTAINQAVANSLSRLILW